MRVPGGTGEFSRTREGFLKGARAVCSLAGLCWIAAVVALILVQQYVSYTVCDGALLQLPPPSIHIPPISHHLELLTLQHAITLVAMGATIIGVFLVLYATEDVGTMRRSAWLVATIAGVLMLALVLWLTGEYFSLRAHLDAVTSCL